MKEKKPLWEKFKEFIPRKISNQTVLRAYDIARHLMNGITSIRSCRNAKKNSEILCKPNCLITSGAYIENQAQWKQVQYGSGFHSNMAHSGCGIIAAYNAYVALGQNPTGATMINMITAFEKDGAAICGEAGTAPSAIRDYFERHGFRVVMTTDRDIEKVNEIGEICDTAIVTVYNDINNIFKQLHTICITREEDGTYTNHNSNIWDKVNKKYVSQIGFKSLQEAIDHLAAGSAAIICTIGISNCKNLYRIKTKGYDE